jgi:molybdate transport system substrate-binding protein
MSIRIMKGIKIVLVIAFLLLFLLGNVIVLADEGDSLLVYSGAGLRKPMDEIAQVFKEKYGVQIQYTYGGSAQNLNQLQLVREGDVYVPGDVYYFEAALEKGLVETGKEVAYHIPVIAVPEGNPAGIETLEDLGNEGVEVILGDEKAAAIGNISQKILAKNGVADSINKNVIAKAATVNELVVYMAMKQADASIIWEDNIIGVEDVEIIYIPEEQNIIKIIPVCVVSFSNKKELATKFVDFVASEEGKNIYQKYGFKPVK